MSVAPDTILLIHGLFLDSGAPAMREAPARDSA
jgi:hypothetical protein